MKKIIGHILSGSLSEGFVMRVNADAHLEDLKTGKFVSIIGNNYAFFSLVTDISLAVTDPDILLFPPSAQEPLLASLLQSKDMYATVQLKPMLMVNSTNRLCPLKQFRPTFHLFLKRQTLTLP